MFTYDMEKRGKIPLYEYLYLCLREDILSGTLKAQEKLPSKRQLASDNGVAVITVENAYAQLQAEGYITSVEKKGYFVNDLGILEKNQGERFANNPGSGGEQFANNPGSGGERFANNPGSGGERFANDSGGTETQLDSVAKSQEFSSPLLVDFTSNHAREDSFPFSIWSKLTRQVLSQEEKNLLTTPATKGVPELRQAISEYLYRSRKMTVDPEQIIIGPGTDYLHMILVQLVGRNRFAGVEDPGYQHAGQIYESNGMKCLHIPVDENGLLVEKLKGSNIRLMHVSPSHHFPTGCTMPISRRLALLEWAKEENSYIVEDEYDSEFRFVGRPIPTLASLNQERVIFMNTFSKTLVPSIRIAYMILPPALMKVYENKMRSYSGTVSSLEQYTLATFIKEGHYERHINRMRNYYRKHRNNILQAIEQSSLHEYVKLEESSAGLHFILRIKRNVDDLKFMEELKEKGIKIAAVSQYCVYGSEQFSHRFIVNYSALDEGQLARALEEMAYLLGKSSLLL